MRQTKGPSATAINLEANQAAERLGENSELYVRPETKAFMSQLLHNLREQRKLINSLRQEQNRNQVRATRPYSSSLQQVAQMCRHRATRLLAIMNEFGQAISDDFSERTPEGKLVQSFERSSAALREIASEYKEVSSLANLPGPQSSLVRGLLDSYLALMNDLDAFFAQGEEEIGLFLDSPSLDFHGRGLLVCLRV